MTKRTVNDIPSHIICPECSKETLVSRKSAIDFHGRIAVTFSCQYCDSLLTITSIDEFKTVDVDNDNSHPII